MEKYIRVDWPESQRYMGNEGVFGAPMKEDWNRYCVFVPIEMFTYYQPLVKGVLPEQMYSFEVFSSRERCVMWLEKYGYDLKDCIIEEFHGEDIEDPTFI